MKCTLYTQYFNPKLSRRLGRKIRLDSAKNFSEQKLESILRGMGLIFTRREGRYPRVPYENCKIYEIESNLKKTTIIKNIERKLI